MDAIEEEYEAVDSPETKALLLDIRTNAVRYWEIRRLIFNALLIVPALLGYFSYQAFSSAFGDLPGEFTIEIGIMFFAAAVGANFCFCFAYVPDLFLQLTDMRESWRRNRWILFTLGCLIGFGLAFLGGQSIGDMQRQLAIENFAGVAAAQTPSPNSQP